MGSGANAPAALSYRPAIGRPRKRSGLSGIFTTEIPTWIEHGAAAI